MGEGIRLLDLPFGKFVQKLDRLGGKLAVSPLEGAAGFAVERIQREVADGGFVVVAADAQGFGKIPDALDAFVRIRPVSDQIPQAPHGIKHPGVFDHCVQGGEIRMDVGDNQDSHRKVEEVYTGRRE